MACRETDNFRHELRWNITKNHELRRRWVHGWFITVYGYAPHPTRFTITNRPEAVDVDVHRSSRVVIEQEDMSSPGAAMTKALAIVHTLRPMGIGWRGKI